MISEIIAELAEFIFVKFRREILYFTGFVFIKIFTLNYYQIQSLKSEDLKKNNLRVLSSKFTIRIGGLIWFLFIISLLLYLFL